MTPFVFAVRVTTLSLILFALLSPFRVAAQEAEPEVSVQDIVVTLSGKGDAQPKSLPPGSLCTLRVKLRNAGTQKASSLAFTVRINGNQVPGYDKTLYFQAIDPGATAEIALSNFYAPESKIQDAKVTVEVTLREARWMEIKKEGKTQTWVPTGEVKGLPASKSISIPLTAAPK